MENGKQLAGAFAIGVAAGFVGSLLSKTVNRFIVDPAMDFVENKMVAYVTANVPAKKKGA